MLCRIFVHCQRSREGQALLSARERVPPCAQLAALVLPQVRAACGRSQPGHSRGCRCRVSGARPGPLLRMSFPQCSPGRLRSAAQAVNHEVRVSKCLQAITRSLSSLSWASHSNLPHLSHSPGRFWWPQAHPGWFRQTSGQPSTRRPVLEWFWISA